MALRSLRLAFATLVAVGLVSAPGFAAERVVLVEHWTNYR